MKNPKEFSDFELFDEYNSYKNYEWQKEYVNAVKIEIKRRYGTIKNFIKFNGFTA